MKKNMTYIHIDEIPVSPFADLLDYPEGDKEKVALRCRELRELNVSGIYAAGPVRADGRQILGLGYCGLVLLGQREERQVAIKLHRSDSTQPSLRDEASHQRCANRAGIGPTLLDATDNILIMDYLPGISLGEWLGQEKALKEPELTRGILRSLLQDAFALDQAGLDHGALRCVAEHAIINRGRATLLDFSHASCRRRAANVTTLVQGLFWGTRLAEEIGRALPLPERGDLIPLLQNYKKQASKPNFELLVNALSL